MPTSDALLSNLVLGDGTLTPAFDPATINYTANVGNSVASTSLAATVDDAGATVKMNGVTLTSGSGISVGLSVGANTFTFVVTASDGVTTKTYTVVITRAAPPSNDAKLSALVISHGTLAPGFSSTTNAYTANVANSITGLTVTPTVNQVNATVKVNGTTVSSGSPSSNIPLIVGINVITIVVTAQDGTTTISYTVTVTRAASAVDTLSNLTISAGTLSPSFASGTANYTASVTNTTTSVTVTPTKTDTNATIKVNGVTVASGSPSGSISLTVGTNNINIVVTAEDGTDIDTYTIAVTRAAIVCRIDEFSPATATPGEKVTITGVGFSGATSVKFGGVDALTFFIVSDTEIDAYPGVSGNGIVTVISPSGTGSLDGFTLIAVKIKMPDSPALGRAIVNADLFWCWDSQTGKLTKITADQLPSGTSGGGSGGGSGNVTTALGSPFKVRTIDDSYFFNGTDSVITDIRLLGKTDYVVTASDVNGDFENYEAPTGALTASATGTTTAPNGTYNTENAVTVTGSGSGSQWRVVITAGAVSSLIQRVGGTGYLVGDTFHIADLPGITFTITSLGGGHGNLIFNETAGTVTIKNYRLSDNKHITIYADGITTTEQQDYLVSLQSKIAAYDKALGPIFTTKGIVWPWRKAANLIPAGWQECTDFRGKMLIGNDPTDVYDATTNPNGLSQAVGTPLGSKIATLIAGNIPQISFNLGTDMKGGSSGYRVLSTVNHNGLYEVTFGNATPVPFAVLNPCRIVYWIEYVG